MASSSLSLVSLNEFSLFFDKERQLLVTTVTTVRNMASYLLLAVSIYSNCCPLSFVHVVVNPFYFS